MVLENLKPKLVWEIFEEVFTKTPRESKKEEKIRAKLVEWLSAKAKSLNIPLKINTDKIGNILVKVPATEGAESYPIVILQGHVDMVCETDRENGFDFDNLPIPIQIEENGEWVAADHTTLGADNGIGCALGLALVFDKEAIHGPLEILLTVDEETGLTGAFQMDIDALELEGKLLINIDSEDLQTITIGSAGGGDSEYRKSFSYADAIDINLSYYQLNVSGLFGGHSGGDIHLPRGNALKLASRIFAWALEKCPVYIASWKGGSKHNAIPRNALVKFAVETQHQDTFLSAFNDSKDLIMTYYADFEENLSIAIETEQEPFKIFTKEGSANLIQFMHQLPHGAQVFSPQVEGLVETSNNLAIIKSNGPEITITCSTRSNLDSELVDFRLKLKKLSQLFGWDATMEPAYPGWKPDPKSSLLKYVSQQFSAILQSEIIIEAIHAGLECGVIGAKIPGMQMLSIGPKIENPHTPEEHVNIASVEKMYQILKDLVKNLDQFTP